jgi:hypothetical protein
MYKPVVHYDAIARAARLMPCPVFANGNVRVRRVGPADRRNDRARAA